MPDALPRHGVDLSGRIAFVTGASSGLGRRFAEVLAEAGATVAVAARRADRLEALVSAIEAKGGKALAVPLDLCSASAIAEAVELVQSRCGLIDILINNAGIADANHATKLPLELIDRVIDTNFRAPFLLSVEVARRLIAHKKPGRIVNISSAGAVSYSPKAVASLYCATKSGLSRMTETLALEWAPFNINVNAILPGMFLSEMTGGYLERMGDEILKTFPRRRFGDPAWLDSTLLYLVSEQSHFVTGACIIADDGQSTR